MRYSTSAMFHIFFIRWINNQVLDAGWKKIEDKKSAIIFFYTIILKLFIFKPKTHKTFFFLGLILKKNQKFVISETVHLDNIFNMFYFTWRCYIPRSIIIYLKHHFWSTDGRLMCYTFFHMYWTSIHLLNKIYF